MKIQHMRKQWIPGPSFFFPAPRASLRAKRGTGDEASTYIEVNLNGHHAKEGLAQARPNYE